MDYVDGLSRLRSEMVGALLMSDLLKDAEADEERPIPVEEARDVSAAAGGVGATRSVPSRAESGTLAGDGEPPEQLLVSPIDVLGLHQERFVE
ncbi:hypothetical protein PI124_g783 [Phytophthora idaei]|nr:hypothetical protein PI125_g24248 [Phytophthora idaei]KAG3165853.1 hypothetical protein PI126_g4449 [Phytophthora idaei]KAG3254675.1 hypothetical protein PI124_g783 [Phytophthora idaei]